MVSEENECNLCGEEFLAKELQDEHMAAMHPLKSKALQTLRRRTLQKKKYSLLQQKTVQCCDQCGYITNRNDCWKSHMNAKHGDTIGVVGKDNTQQNPETLANEIVTEFENSVEPGRERARKKAVQLLMETNSYMKQGNIEPFSINDLKDLILETQISTNKTIKLMMKFKRKWGIDLAETHFRTKLVEALKDTVKTNNQQPKPRTGREKKCKICEKDFSCGFTLGRHMKMHTVEKPYLCPMCDSSFSSFDLLKQHKVKH